MSHRNAPRPPRALPARTRVPFVSTPSARPKTGKLSSAGMTTIVLEVPTAAGNALVAAVEEVRSKVGARLEQPAVFAREDALTMAAIGLGALAAQLHRQGFREDANYGR